MNKTSDTKGKSKGAADGRALKRKAIQTAKSRLARPAKQALSKVRLVSSKLSYRGPLFDVYTDEIRENGRQLRRDVIRHNGSVVILALEDTADKNDPLVILEKQYRHAAGEFLLELPAGKMEAGEDPLGAAKRELLEETGFRAARWRKLVHYFASPGFLDESMQIFIAQGLKAGEAQPEYDEQIELQMVRASEVLRMIDKGKIHDGKTLVALLLYERLGRLGSGAAVRGK